MGLEFATPDSRHNLTSWALAWSLYICIGVPLVVWSTVAFWACLWLSVLYFAFHLLIYGVSNGPKTFWHYITGHTDLPKDLELEYEKPRAAFEEWKRSPVATPAWPGHKTIAPKGSRQSSGTSVKDFESAYTPTPTGPVPNNASATQYAYGGNAYPNFRSRAESVAVIASNVDGDFGDTGGWATSFEDDEHVWTAKNTRFEQTAFTPGLYGPLDTGAFREAGSPRWSFADSMVRTPLAVVRTPSSNIDPKEDRRKSLIPGTRSGRATPTVVGAYGGNDGYFPPQMMDTSPTQGLAAFNFQPRRQSMLHKMHRNTPSLDSVPEAQGVGEDEGSDES